MTSLTLIGAGRMVSAMAGGWIGQGFEGTINIVSPNSGANLVELGMQHGVRVELNPNPAPANILVVAVKPQVFPSVAPSLLSWIGPDTLVLSVMGGIPMSGLSERLGTSQVARAMPNTPGLIGKGVTILCLPEDAAPGTEAKLRSLLEPLGTVEGPISEDLLPAATVVSGCGPAYGFLLAEVMAEAGIAHGLEPDLARRLARKTVEGAGALMEASDEDAATLRQNVTSPGGVTKAALDILMEREAMPSLFERAFENAILRDRELAKGSK